MLSEIAAEVLRFLGRRDLDRACAVSRWLDALIAQCCDVYPLRFVHSIALDACKDFTLIVRVKEDRISSFQRQFSILREAVNFASSIVRHSYVVEFKMDVKHMGFTMTLSPDHWTTLLDAIRSGAVRRLHFSRIDFSELEDDAFRVALGSRGFVTLVVEHSVVPSGLLTDGLLRSIVAKHHLELRFSENESDAQYRLSDDAVLDFYFPADAAPGGQWRSLELRDSAQGLTDMFLAKFFKRLRSSNVAASGRLHFCGAPKQGDLSAYDAYLTDDGMLGTRATYRFPSIDGNVSYKVVLFKSSAYLSMQFYVMNRSL